MSLPKLARVRLRIAYRNPDNILGTMIASVNEKSVRLSRIMNPHRPDDLPDSVLFVLSPTVRRHVRQHFCDRHYTIFVDPVTQLITIIDDVTYLSSSPASSRADEGSNNKNQPGNPATGTKGQR